MTKRCIRTLRCVLLSPFNGWKKQKPKAEKDSVILLKSPQQAKGGGQDSNLPAWLQSSGSGHCADGPLALWGRLGEVSLLSVRLRHICETVFLINLCLEMFLRKDHPVRDSSGFDGLARSCHSKIQSKERCIYLFSASISSLVLTLTSPQESLPNKRWEPSTNNPLC